MKRIVCMVLILTMVIMGCATGSESQKDQEDRTTVENKFAESDGKSKDVIKESSGQISYGYLDENKDVYEYNGKDVEIPFYIENQGQKDEGTATIGLLLLVDGNVQNFRIKTNGKTETMQKITLKPKERKEFKLMFKPVSGKKGEKVGVIPATIWNPDNLPDEKNPSWGNNQSLTANIPLEIYMKCDGENRLKGTKKNVKTGDIPEEILNDYKDTYVSDVYDSLDTMVNFMIETSDKNKSIIYGNGGKVPITMKLYGGKNVKEKITVFVNNNPVKLDQKDYIEVKTKKGKMLTITANLDLSGYDRINSVYAIVMTSGQDYKMQDIYKTDSILLINKGNTEKKNKEQDEALNLSKEGEKLVLKDLITDKVVNKYQLGEKQYVDSLVKFDEGYCVRIYKVNRKLKNQVIEGITVEDAPDESEIINASMVFFDREFHKTDKVNVGRLAKVKQNKDLLTANFTVSVDGSKIAWDVGDNILCYNRGTKNFTEYNQIAKKDIVVENLLFSGNDKLAFLGSKGESEEDTCYGYLNLEDKKVCSFIEKKYEAFSLNADTRYIWLNDGEKPEGGPTSGKMPFIDTKTGEKHIIHLDNIESTKARITEDGKYIIAVSQSDKKTFRVRRYDAKSEKLMSEKKYNFSEKVHVSDIISISNGKAYGVVYGTDKGDRLEKVYDITVG